MENRIRVIAECGINYNNDMNLVKELIGMTKSTGCQVVKFQKRTVEQCRGLESRSKNVGIDFIVSRCDKNGVDFIKSNYNIRCYKASSEFLTDKLLLGRLNATKKPVIASTGMSTGKKIGVALSILKSVKYLLAYTSSYPTKDEKVNLKYILTLKNKYLHLRDD